MGSGGGRMGGGPGPPAASLLACAGAALSLRG